MTETLKRHAAFLRLLAKATPKTRKAMLKSNCTKDFIKCISELARNTLKGNVDLSPAQLDSLRRRKQTLRAISLKKTSLRKKRKLIQSGGFLGALIGPVISILSNLLSNGSR